MKFTWLEQACRSWRDIRVIGKSLQQGDRRYHIAGMALGEEARLYVLGPYLETDEPRRPARTQRQLQRGSGMWVDTYLGLEEIRIGTRQLRVGGSTGQPLVDHFPSEEVLVLYEFLRAGWEVPGWLKELDWECLELWTLELSGVKRLPPYTPDTPILLRHGAQTVRHLLEKPVTLTVGQSRTLSFTDHRGETVRCYINGVSLVDVWGEMDRMLQDPCRWAGLPPEQVQPIKEGILSALEHKCPRGMYSLGLEYECRQDLSLQFYTKAFLRSAPRNEGSGALVLSKGSRRRTGPHGLPVRACTLEAALPPDAKAVPAELFAYYEQTEPWEETV